jgi:DNA-binding transcriptional LysR family regulator
MEISQLEALLAIVDAGTFSAAAERLALTQSALTRKIQALEAECGTTLLVRSRPRVEPTATGRAVLTSARRIQLELDQLGELVAPHRTEPHGRIRAVATPIGLTYLYWPICEQFLKSHPLVDLAFQDVELPADGPRLVRAGAADVAFAALPLPGAESRLNTLPLGSVESILVAHPDHPLVAALPVALEQLRHERMVLYRRRTDNREFANQTWLSQLGDHPSTLETGDVEYLKRLAMLGRGMTVLPWPSVQAEVETGKLARIRVQEADVVQAFGLVYAAGRIPRAVGALIDFCRALPSLELLAVSSQRRLSAGRRRRTTRFEQA